MVNPGATDDTVLFKLPMTVSSKVDFAFSLVGKQIPLDHGYLLFAALIDSLAQLRDDPTWALHPIAGQPLGEDRLALHRGSYLKIRAPVERLPQLLPLSGRPLRLGNAQVLVGVPRVFTLEPSAQLHARYVTIKGFMEPEPFLSALRRQLATLEDLGQDPERILVDVGARRITRVRGDAIVGFAVDLGSLEPQASLKIQEAGLGGRRHVGGGLFVPPAQRGRR